MGESPFSLIKQVGTEVNSILSPIDVYGLDRAQQKLVAIIKQELMDVRLDIRDYEFAETRAEQQDDAKAAKERLERLRSHLLAASEHNLFGAADIAQLTARLDSIVEHLH
jgi:hypothetical protein